MSLPLQHGDFDAGAGESDRERAARQPTPDDRDVDLLRAGSSAHGDAPTRVPFAAAVVAVSTTRWPKGPPTVDACTRRPRPR